MKLAYLKRIFKKPYSKKLVKGNPYNGRDIVPMYMHCGGRCYVLTNKGLKVW